MTVMLSNVPTFTIVPTPTTPIAFTRLIELTKEFSSPFRQRTNVRSNPLSEECCPHTGGTGSISIDKIPMGARMLVAAVNTKVPFTQNSWICFQNSGGISCGPRNKIRRDINYLSTIGLSPLKGIKDVSNA